MRAPILFALLAGLAGAQDDELPPDAQTPPALEAEAAAAEHGVVLSKALKRLTDGADWVVHADVRHETKEPAGLGGAGGAVMIMKQVGPGGTPFEGQVEAWHTADGAVVVASAQAFPGFALYAKDGRTLKEVTFEDEVPELEQLRAELATICDRARLAGHLLRAGLKASEDPHTGDLVFRGKVDRGIVRPMQQGPGMGMLAKRVVDADAVVTVSPEGELKEMRVRVRHSDPVHRMMQGELKAVRIQIQGGGVPVPQDDGGHDDADEKHDAPTGSTTYTLVPGGRAPSERAQAFKEKAEAILNR